MGGERHLPETTNARALSYMLKSYVGPGCLSLPLAYQHAGWGVGTFLLLLILGECSKKPLQHTHILPSMQTVNFIFYFLCLGAVTWNLRSIVLCKRFHDADGVRTFADIALVTFGTRGRRLLDLLVNICQFGICAIYFDFVAENVNSMVPLSWKNFASIHLCMLYVFPLFGALALLPSVDSIAPYASFANFFMLAVILIVLGFTISELQLHGTGDGSTIGEALNWPIFFATVVYSCEGINNCLPVENALKDKDAIFWLLYLSMGIIAGLYCLVGLLCYMAWPDISKASITAQLAEDYPDSVMVQISAIFVILAVIFTFPLQVFPAVETLELRLGLVEPHAGPIAGASTDLLRKLSQQDRSEDLALGAMSLTDDLVPDDDKLEADLDSLDVDVLDCNSRQSSTTTRIACLTCSQVIFRIGLVAFCGITAALVPNLGNLIALVGAINGSLLAIIIPAVIDLNCPRPAGWDPYFSYPEAATFVESKMRSYEIFVDVVIVIFGIICGVWSSILSVYEAAQGS